MAGFDNEQKEYLGGALRGLLLALGTGHLNSAMRAGDPDWVPPRTLLDVMNAIGNIPGGGGLSAAQVRGIVRQEIDKTKLKA